MTKPNLRYKLNIGKYGFYFFDKKLKVDLTLEMVLNYLNKYENKILNAYKRNALLKKEIADLKRDD